MILFPKKVYGFCNTKKAREANTLLNILSSRLIHRSLYWAFFHIEFLSLHTRGMGSSSSFSSMYLLGLLFFFSSLFLVFRNFGFWFFRYLIYFDIYFLKNSEIYVFLYVCVCATAIAFIVLSYISLLAMSADWILDTKAEFKLGNMFLGFRLFKFVNCVFDMVDIFLWGKREGAKSSREYTFFILLFYYNLNAFWWIFLLMFKNKNDVKIIVSS